MHTIDRPTHVSHLADPDRATDRQARSPHSLRDSATHRRTMRWIACTGTALCLAFSISAFAAGTNGMNGAQGNGNGIGTQGPANDAMPGSPAAGLSGECTSDRPEDQALMGKSVAQATTMLRGCPWRIGEQDGKAMPTTRDHRPDRRTLTIENGKVTGVQRG